jgi:hypothetical protein
VRTVVVLEPDGDPPTDRNDRETVSVVSCVQGMNGDMHPSGLLLKSETDATKVMAAVPGQDQAPSTPQQRTLACHLAVSAP